MLFVSAISLVLKMDTRIELNCCFFLLFGSTGSDVEGEDDGEDDGLEYDEDEDDDEEGGHVSLSAVRNKSKLFKRAVSIIQKKIDSSHVYI